MQRDGGILTTASGDISGTQHNQFKWLVLGLMLNLPLRSSTIFTRGEDRIRPKTEDETGHKEFHSEKFRNFYSSLKNDLGNKIWVDAIGEARYPCCGLKIHKAILRHSGMWSQEVGGLVPTFWRNLLSQYSGKNIGADVSSEVLVSGVTFQNTEILLLAPLWTSGLSEAKNTTWGGGHRSR